METFVKCAALCVFGFKVSYSCTFPKSYQGTYLTQTRPNFRDDISSMSEVLIGERDIKPWGQCYGMLGTQYIISKRTGIKSCMRCFHLIQRSEHILEATTESMEYCYTDYNSANISCQAPTLHHQALFLYRKNRDDVSTDNSTISCPIVGRYKVNYSLDSPNYRCTDYSSVMDNCPDSGYLVLKFRRCNFGDYDLTYKCIGHWLSPQNRTLLAIMEVNNRMSKVGKNIRCGTYRRDNNSGHIYLSLYASSGCTDQPYPSAIGYETFVFLQAEEKPSLRLGGDILCQFPSWSLGKWQDLQVNSQSLFFEGYMQNVTSYCFGNDSNSDLGIYLTKTVDNCGKETYRCLWLTRRSLNIIEYQFAKGTSERPHSSLCTLHQFDQEWKTKARIPTERKAACPVFGVYRGSVPGTENICAQLTTECNQTEIIRYQIHSCANREVFEDQRYQCHGSWEDNGFVYTYTTRQDSKENQCFVGRISKYGKEIVIAELGDHCYRRHDPLKRGMKMFRQASCPRRSSVNGASTTSYWQIITTVLLLTVYFSFYI